MQHKTLTFSKCLTILCAMLVTNLYVNSSSAVNSQPPNGDEPLIQLAQTKSKSHEGKISADKRPNILIIVADDMGWSDIGPFGSEIRTPSLDKMADNGLKFTQFYVNPACSPTRSSLMSGTDHHLTGMGTNAEILSEEQRKNPEPGYEGYLNDRVVSVADTLKN
jgi:hypothetical protein